MITIKSLISITNNDGILVTGSLEMALNFGKRHSDTLRAIENLIEQMNSTQNCVQCESSSSQNWLQYFIPDEYRDSSGKMNKQYLLTRDGFSLLVMGFTGQKALQWKLKYIDAFNVMEQTLKSGKFSVHPMELQCIKETNKTLRFIQDKNLRDSIAKQVLSKLYDIEITSATSNKVITDKTVTDFIEGHCEMGGQVKIGKLYETYGSWCRLMKRKPLTKINFGREIVLLGVDRVHIGAGRFWSGIRLKEGLNKCEADA